jgi:hypothetical protein
MKSFFQRLWFQLVLWARWLDFYRGGRRYTTVHGHKAYWRHDGTCSRCGSFTVSHAMALLQVPGTRFSGCNWAYARWPDKFLIHPPGGKGWFCTVHLREVSKEEFERFAALSARFFGIGWERNSRGQVTCNCHVRPNYRRWGVIDPRGEPLFGEYEASW